MELKRRIKFATLNIRGIKKAGQRKEIEDYMWSKGIDIMTLHETHSSGTQQENHRWYSWYFSGGPEGETCDHGVCIVISNWLRNYIVDTEPISARLMAITLRGKVPIHIVSAYAPIADASTEEKDVFYEALKKQINKH